MKTYRVAIVGLGRMASTIDDEVVGYPSIALPYSIAAACKASPRLECVAGADILPEKREAFRGRWGVSALYADYLEMIDRERPDLVAICTRGELHASMSVQVAQAGVKMIFCEKAVACSMKEADAVLNACRDLAFNTGVLRRFDSRYHAARQAIARGDIGQPRVAVHYAATNLLHGHIHSVDTLMYLLGDPQVESVSGELRPRDTKIENNRLDRDPNAVYHIAFAGGVEAWSVPAGNWDFEVIGTEGAIRGMNNGADWELRKVEAAGRHRSFRPAPYQPPAPFSATVYLLEDIVRAFEEGRPTLGNAEVTHRATEVCLAVAESHRQGNVRLSLPIANRDLYVWHV
ncbi:Gfo/Idh/MocA family oxidoreductase [bacterium]|nr:Gfo/Idh/MocA family oxidoreductase [bacterium]